MVDLKGKCWTRNTKLVLVLDYSWFILSSNVSSQHTPVPVTSPLAIPAVTCTLSESAVTTCRIMVLMFLEDANPSR
jgi:hypothetical protein